MKRTVLPYPIIANCAEKKRSLAEIKLTPFEWKVLAATTRIPLGETRSYQWVAKTIGKPKAVRAVGQALKKNPFLVMIPCHRVIRSDGQLGGYAGGEKRKVSLLRFEAEIAQHLSLGRTAKISKKRLNNLRMSQKVVE